MPTLMATDMAKSKETLNFLLVMQVTNLVLFVVTFLALFIEARPIASTLAEQCLPLALTARSGVFVSPKDSSLSSNASTLSPSDFTSYASTTLTRRDGSTVAIPTILAITVLLGEYAELSRYQAPLKSCPVVLVGLFAFLQGISCGNIRLFNVMNTYLDWRRYTTRLNSAPAPQPSPSVSSPPSAALSPTAVTK
ncbi:hypothetical protein H0H92_005602 [Tricholoma furcatifolium]|nr:hypothetical protein H0H92_005602 [Tricholoma furcatifolium]